jgi:hypothetical protein
MSLKVAWFGDSTLEPEMRYHGFKVCAWFQPLNLKCDILVSSLCFQMGQLVCRYRPVQRILMELLNQMDGFDQTVNVKVIMVGRCKLNSFDS